MKHLIFILFLWAVGLPVFAQWKLEDTCMIREGRVVTDILGTRYLIDGVTLYKINNKNQVQSSYSNINLGGITSADVSNPLKITVFYDDFDFVVFIDNKLTPLRDPVSLADLRLTDVQAVCSSQQGGFWVYDNADRRIKYFDSNLQKVSESNSIELKELSDKGVILSEFTDYLLLNFEQNNVFVFDKFAGFLVSLPISEVYSMYASGENIYMVTPTQFVIYNLKNHTMRHVDLPESGFSQAVFNGNRLFLVINNILKIYSVVEN